MLLTGLAATAAALLAMAWLAAPSGQQVPGLGRLGAGLLLVGLLGGSVNGASGRAVMGWFAEGERGLAMSIRQTAVPLGGAVGVLLLPAVALHLGYAAMYGLLATLCGLSALLAWAWVHEPPVPGALREFIPHLLTLQGWPLVWLAAAGCAAALPLLSASQAKASNAALSRCT